MGASHKDHVKVMQRPGFTGPMPTELARLTFVEATGCPFPPKAA